MDESGVYHAISGGGSAPQAFKIFEIASMGFGAGGDERCGG